MQSVFRFVTLPSQCHYLPGETSQMEYEVVAAATPGEYRRRMHDGWRRFGYTMFRPRCQACQACQSLRVLVDRFQPNRSQRRVRAMNEHSVRLEVGEPSATPEKLELYDRYHAYQSAAKDWPTIPPKELEEYVSSYVHNPFPTLEYCYYLDSRLIGVGYVDKLPGALSAIYYFYDPDQRRRSPGTWNVLSVIDSAAAQGIPYVYLGYHVVGCPSLEYKANFVPNEVRHADGRWRAFRC